MKKIKKLIFLQKKKKNSQKILIKELFICDIIILQIKLIINLILVIFLSGIKIALIKVHLTITILAIIKLNLMQILQMFKTLPLIILL